VKEGDGKKVERRERESKKGGTEKEREKEEKGE